MAQADSVPTAIRTSGVGERADRSTKRRAVRPADRRYFIGGSDARIIIGDDETALLRLWREKRGEIEPEDLAGNLVVQLGVATEELNRRWYQANSGQVLTDVQRRIRHPVLRWMAATLDGRVEATGAVFEAKTREWCGRVYWHNFRIARHPPAIRSNAGKLHILPTGPSGGPANCKFPESRRADRWETNYWSRKATRGSTQVARRAGM